MLFWLTFITFITLITIGFQDLTSRRLDPLKSLQTFFFCFCSSSKPLRNFLPHKLIPCCTCLLFDLFFNDCICVCNQVFLDIFLQYSSQRLHIGKVNFSAWFGRGRAVWNVRASSEGQSFCFLFLKCQDFCSSTYFPRGDVHWFTLIWSFIPSSHKLQYQALYKVYLCAWWLCRDVYHYLKTLGPTHIQIHFTTNSHNVPTQYGYVTW